jgi:hypothetical protein
MSSPEASTSLVEIRHLQLGEQITDDQLTRSALFIVGRAGTSNLNESNDVWRTPVINQSRIG